MPHDAALRRKVYLDFAHLAGTFPALEAFGALELVARLKQLVALKRWSRSLVDDFGAQCDMIFTLRMALELARVKKIDLHVVFDDLMKAYDSVNRNGLCGIFAC